MYSEYIYIYIYMNINVVRHPPPPVDHLGQGNRQQ